MGAYGLSWAIPGMVGPLLAGLIMDKFDPRWLWYASGLVGLTAAAGFVLLRKRMGDSLSDQPAKAVGAAGDGSE